MEKSGERGILEHQVRPVDNHQVLSTSEGGDMKGRRRSKRVSITRSGAVIREDNKHSLT